MAHILMSLFVFYYGNILNPSGFGDEDTYFFFLVFKRVGKRQPPIMEYKFNTSRFQIEMMSLDGSFT